MVNLSQHPGNSGFTSTGIACKDAMEHHILARTESSTTTLEEESGIVGHRADTFLHAVETDHLVQLAHALFEGRKTSGNSVEAEVINRKFGNLFQEDV